MNKAGSKRKRSTSKRTLSSPQPRVEQMKTVCDLMNDLSRAIEERKYGEVEQIGNILLDSNLSEEADRHLNDIIISANTIRDAEDEISYQFQDLKTELGNLGDPEGLEVDGL